MRPQEKIICRLCLQVCDNFRAIEGYVKNALDIVLPKVDLAVIQAPTMCINCVELLMNCFDFKATCLSTHDYVVPFVNNEDTIKLDLRDVYLSKNENVTGFPEGQVICGFCMSPVKNCSAIHLDADDGNVLESMIEQCLPELDLSIIKKPIICAPCHCSLENCFHFVTNCLIVEDKIKKYYKNLDANSKNQIELSDVLQFTMRNVTASEVGGNLGDVIKVEKEFYEESENADERVIGNRDGMFKLEQVFCEDSENVKEEVEHEIKSFMDVDGLKFDNDDHFTPENMLACKEDSNNFDVIKMEETLCGEEKLKEESLVEMGDQKFLVNEEIEIKSEEQGTNRFEDESVSLQSELATSLHRRWKSLKSNHEEGQSKPDLKHILKNEDVSKIMCKHECCSFKTSKPSLEIHCRLYKNRSETAENENESCSYQTGNKYDKSNLLMYKDPSGMTVYKCDSCSYQTKFKANLKKHILVHKDPSEMTMYKCDSCSYQTKFNTNLTKHLLVHKDPSEVTVYKCASCAYQTKNKSYLKKHILVHEDSSEIAMYKCDSCSYQARQRSAFKTHLLVHMDSSEVTVYKCDSCSYQTRVKGNIKLHLLVHKDQSEVTMYKCDSCSYQSKYKDTLKRHLQLHKDRSEVTMYKCDSCSYQARQKSAFKTHLLIHMDTSDVTMYKCDSCSYQTKDKGRLKMHLRVHKDPSELTMHKCDSCLYQTRYKSNHKKHLLIHKDPSELTAYKCGSCSYQTRFKNVLKKHVLAHIKPEHSSVS